MSESLLQPDRRGATTTDSRYSGALDGKDPRRKRVETSSIGSGPQHFYFALCMATIVFRTVVFVSGSTAYYPSRPPLTGHPLISEKIRKDFRE